MVLDGDDPAIAIVHGRDLRADHDLIAAAGSLVIAALRHQRLAARLATSSAQLDESRRRMVRAADVERARIERDLHDGAQQRLITLRIHLSLAEELLRADPAAGAEAVSELGAEVDQTLDELRALAHGVYPSLLSDRGLADALRSLTSAAPLPVHLQTCGLTRHSAEIETAVYFTCGEALQNAFKHARSASCVWIDLRQNNRTLSLEIRDDGPGFVPPPRDGNSSANRGLRNMRDRLEAVGGSLTLDSAPDHGTRLIGVVPLH
jgi:signal transduction histidine kinase